MTAREEYLIKSANSITITHGPSREELSHAFIYAYDRERNAKAQFRGRRTAKFEEAVDANKEGVFTAQVVSLRHEDGGGNNFMVEAYLSVKPVRGRLVKFFYDADQRRGHINVRP